MMRSLIWPPGLLVLALLLGGCLATFDNVPTPETPRERLAALEITYQGANRSIQDLVAAGTLHGEAAVRVADVLKTAQVAMQVARAGVDGLDGTELLDVANEALIALTARLRAEEAQ